MTRPPASIFGHLAGLAVWMILVCALPRVFAAPPPTYYDAATGLTGGPLKQALHGIIANQTVVPYGNLITPLRVIWRDPANPANIILTYSGASVSASSSWNREHLWPRARGNSDQAGPDDSDLFHVVPTDISVNAERGSLYFDQSDPGDPSYRLPAHSLAPQTSRDSDSWQPPPQERGDIARALFYMDVRYDGQEALTTDMELVSFPPSGSQMGRLNTLLLWNEQDPPDDTERARNDLIYNNYQHNRNPFIDHPEWVAQIWGTGVPNTPGNRPIARVRAVAASAVESPQLHATFEVLLNQFAGAGGVTVSFSMSGTAGLAEYTLSGSGLTYDPATGVGSVLIPENFSSALLVLSPVNDGVPEAAESAAATLSAGTDYTVVPDASSVVTLTISDTPSLPASWNFDSPPYTNPLPANAGAGAISFSSWLGTITNFGGSPGQALTLAGNTGNNSWIDIRVSMTGYTGLALSFQTRGTNTGYDVGTWSASVDRVNFIALPGVNTATRNPVFSQKRVDFSSIPALTDAPEVTLRYTLSGATSSGGNNRIDDLAITASPFVSSDALRTVSVVAADATANEQTLDPGTFAVQLNGLAPPGGLDVLLSFSGTASDADFTLAGFTSYDPVTRIGHLFFPEGRSAALVMVTPLADDVPEPSETVIARVESSPAYLVNASNTAIVTIFAPAEPVANDSFSNAIALSGAIVSTTGSNVGATHETGEPSHGSTGARSVWWKWQAPASGTVEIKTSGSSYDTLLGLYTGSSVGSLTQLAADDDSGGSLASLVAARVQASETYYIAVDGYGSAAGQIALAIRFSPLPTVALRATLPVLQERGNIPGQVQCTLSNSSPLPIDLMFFMSGSARLGIDYTASATRPVGSYIALTVPAYATTVDLQLPPLTDSDLLERTETISITLGNSTIYRIEPNPANVVELTLEDDSPYSSGWLDAHPGLTAEMAQPFEDADHDGVVTLLEFIADLDPRRADGGPLLSITPEVFLDPADAIEKTFAAIRFRRRVDAASIPLDLEESDTLDAGFHGDGGVFISATPIAGTPYEMLLFRSLAPLSETQTRFFRLRATLP